MTIRISWSQLRVHEECKQRGFLQRSGKKATLDNKRMFFPGTVTDRVVRDWLNNEPLKNLGAMPDMVDAIIDREREVETVIFKSKNDRNEILADCREAVEKIEPALKRYVLPFEYQADVRFTTPLSLPHPDGSSQEVNLIGAMDILVRYAEPSNEKWFVWDVKHTRDNGYWRKTVGQLAFYDLSVQLMHGKPTSMYGLLQPLCDEPVKMFKPEPEARAQLLQRIAGMATDLWNDHFPVRPDNSVCGFCNVKHACPKFTPVNGRMAF